MKRIIKIGTRDSQLAIWQAEKVKKKLAEQSIESELVLIKSDGDLDLVTPLYEMGVQGVFTKTLDAALLSNRIDLAVHSMKDVPTGLATGLIIGGVLERGSYKDVLVLKNTNLSLDNETTASPLTIATSSIRRKAQWLNRYPHHKIDNLRGNVNTRLRKVEENEWFGAIFAAAGLERLELCQENKIDIDWMLPAPAQGVICIACRKEDLEMKALCKQINDPSTLLCATIERDFLRTLMGGCSTPIAALAQIKDDSVYFRGRICSLDGKESKDIECITVVSEAEKLGETAAIQLLKEGADRIVEEIRNV